jgi:S1-C subfamily serine protease
MIRQTLQRTKQGTFAVELPNPFKQLMPCPVGTGFFVSRDGVFVTAAHVVTQNSKADGPPRDDIEKGWLMTEPPPGEWGRRMCLGLSLVSLHAQHDIAILKVDLSENRNKSWMLPDGFPFVPISFQKLEEGEPVYSFGYPLSHATTFDFGDVIYGDPILTPRVTSAIISSTLEQTEMVRGEATPEIYVLDKALNYGSSGGPIVSCATGNAHAVCSRFIPVAIPQRASDGRDFTLKIPSLYSVGVGLSNSSVRQSLESLGVSQKASKLE